MVTSVRVVKLVAMIAVFLVTSGVARASAIVYSTFGPGDSYSTAVANAVSSSGSELHLENIVAEGFTPAATYTLDGIRLTASYDSGSPNELDVALQADTSGQPSGIPLESWVFTNLPTSASILSAASGLHPTLAAGIQYWLVASVPGAGSTFDSWFRSDPAVFGMTAGSHNGEATWLVSPGQIQTAFEIDGTPVRTSTVPEPATLTLTALGSIGVVRRYRRRASR